MTEQLLGFGSLPSAEAPGVGSLGRVTLPGWPSETSAQKSVFESLGRSHGDYTVFAAMIEGLMMPSPLAALDEYGIPLQTARKLQAALEPQGDLDAVLERLRQLDPGALQLHPFERELLADAQRYL